MSRSTVLTTLHLHRAYFLSTTFFFKDLFLFYVLFSSNVYLYTTYVQYL